MDQDYREAMKLSNQLCFPLYAAARNVTGLYTPCLKPLGLTYTQYIVFLVLWEKDGIPVGEIGEKLMLDNGTLSPLLKKMEQAGYIERQRSHEDDLPTEKAGQLYALLYELLDNQGYENPNTRKEQKNENSL